MSYDAGLAEMQLTGTTADLPILAEREKRYSIGLYGSTDRMVIQIKQYWELCNMYTRMIGEKKKQSAFRKLVNANFEERQCADVGVKVGYE